MYIKVKATTNAGKENFHEVSKDSFHISVKEKAERNKANKRLLELLADHFDVSEKDVKIVSGHHSHRKTVNIDK